MRDRIIDIFFSMRQDRHLIVNIERWSGPLGQSYSFRYRYREYPKYWEGAEFAFHMKGLS